MTSPFSPNGIPALWDLPNSQSLSAINDEDFLAILQGQFNSNSPATDPFKQPLLDIGIPQPQQQSQSSANPQALSIIPTSITDTPPLSDDNSPSPPSTQLETDVDSIRHNRTRSGADEDLLKRKASDEDSGEEPSHKTQHTDGSRKSVAPSRRKSGPGASPDESKLMKRKEQNRAAQRAFRERKEKHVRDLEDRLADLEAKSDEREVENNNLRDLLSRLQRENASLKEAQFTFRLPSSSTGASSSSGPSQPSTSPRAATQPEQIFYNSFGALPLPMSIDPVPAASMFDPSLVTPEASSPAPSSSTNPYTTIAFDPMAMSFADTFSFDQGSDQGNNGSGSNFTPFSFSASTPSSSSNNGGNQDTTMSDLGLTEFPSTLGSLDDFFANYGGGTGLTPMSNPLSPVSHANTLGSTVGVVATEKPQASTSLSSNPADHNMCRTKDGLAQIIAHKGDSPFAPVRSPSASSPSANSISSASPSSSATRVAGLAGRPMPSMACNPSWNGRDVPFTQPSDRNIDVETAWQKITSLPHLQVLDVNDLCEEFTRKAKCDGSKKVLEPCGVKQIVDNMTKKAAVVRAQESQNAMRL